MDVVFDDIKMVDAFRRHRPEDPVYTWWSNRGRAWDNDVGWRIDYQVVTPKLGGTVQQAEVYRDERFSDHAPLTMAYDWSLG